jgi:hypothetical protein
MKYTQDLLKKFGMKDAKPIKMPMRTNGHLDLDTRGKSVNQKVYRSMICFIYVHVDMIVFFPFSCVLDFNSTPRNVTLWPRSRF